MNFNDLLKAEFNYLEETLYLDYAGAMTLSHSMVQKLEKITKSVVSNPHSDSESCDLNQDIDYLRSTLCRRMGTHIGEYDVIITQNSTEALQMSIKMIATDKKMRLHYLIDNHNSVLGLNEFIRRMGGTSRCVNGFPDDSIGPDSLFVFPYQSNFSGTRYKLDWVKRYQENGGIVLLDCASSTFCQLGDQRPNFITLSLLKLTGIHGGALLVRRNMPVSLSDPLPSGGNVRFSCARTGAYNLLSPLYKKYEQGTLSYIDLSLAAEALRVRAKIGTEEQIIEHLDQVSSYFYEQITSLTHSSGKRLVNMYSERDSNHGHTFSFNCFNSQGNLISHQDLSFLFGSFRIVVRFGGHCNPGAGFAALQWDEAQIEKISQEKESEGRCLSSICDIEGHPLGTIRVSFGATSSFKDVDKFVALLKAQLLDGGPCPKSGPIITPMRIDQMFVYPIQGATGFQVTEWNLLSYGFEYDRNWKLFDAEGLNAMTPRTFRLACMQPRIASGKLIISFPEESIEVDINDFEEDTMAPNTVKQYGRVYSRHVTDFFFRVLGKDFYLVKLPKESIGRMTFCSANAESLKYLPDTYSPQTLRANLIFSGAPAFSEEGEVNRPIFFKGLPVLVWKWRTACMTLSIDTKTCSPDLEPMRKLFETRGRSGQLVFGSLFKVKVGDDPILVRIGDSLTDF